MNENTIVGGRPSQPIMMKRFVSWIRFDQIFETIYDWIAIYMVKLIESWPDENKSSFVRSIGGCHYDRLFPVP